MEYKINDYLNEGRNADKAIKNTYAVIKNFFNNASWLDNTYNERTLNPDNLTVMEYIEHSFRTDYFGTNVSDSVIRLEPIMMNVALKLGFEQNNSDGEKLKRLQDIITYIKLNSKKENFPIQLNKLTLENTSFDTLNELFGKVIDYETTQDNEQANQYNDNSKINPNYSIIEINSQNEAKKYGQYSCHNSILCYTTYEEKWKEFTNNGINKVYLILNKNWQNIPEKYGENNPYDEYGLSMIFLFINPDGNIAFSNTRWNHGTREHVNNVDHSFTKSQISKLLNINFDSVFKPYSEEEIKSKEPKTIEKIISMLKQGAPLEDIFDKVKPIGNGLIEVYHNNKCSIITPKRELIGNGDIWFDRIGKFYDGFAIVYLNGEYSIINENGNLIGNMWFDWVEPSSEGFFIVMNDDKLTFMDTHGNFINNGNSWFDKASSFKEGFAVVSLNNKYSFIDKNGNFINNGKSWFDKASSFKNNLAMVKQDNNISFVDKNGKLIGNGNIWFDKDSNPHTVYNNLITFDENDKTLLYDTLTDKFYDAETKQEIQNPLVSPKNEETKKLIKTIIKEIIKNKLFN